MPLFQATLTPLPAPEPSLDPGPILRQLFWREETQSSKNVGHLKIIEGLCKGDQRGSFGPQICLLYTSDAADDWLVV